MRILLSTIGSRGDVQPLVALATQLKALDQDVHLCVPPDVKAAQSSDPVTGNVTTFRRPPAPRPKPAGSAHAKPRLPVALIFACLVVVYAGIRYFLQ